MPFPPQKTQLSLKPRLVIDVLPNSAISLRASSLSLKKIKKTINMGTLCYLIKIGSPRIFNKYKIK
jgi:hypothetical protein